jgi:hypothetical protein
MRDRASTVARELQQQLRCTIDRLKLQVKELFHLETAAKLSMLLEPVSTIFSKCALKSLDSQALIGVQASGVPAEGHGQRLKLLTHLSNFKGKEGTVNQPSYDFVGSSPTSPPN